ncbi:hypothetical protein [Endozoicomonas sp. GU-1]|uniref:hypothetical protein n=1 Tax=Endozoicomonas sp. GU-1 TaxID=3009078 RepID=UPI0022B4111B|nr:hypothetical protein [Endozoicomonas sp. GU-1]WBA82778.1 hypothetical protein O2T12_06520 [Endozoicomonas sp. GU-1]WBA85706.1 hypothetical protein O3276_21165 [Endozoicomonas sp. GU-1]
MDSLASNFKNRDLVSNAVKSQDQTEDKQAEGKNSQCTFRGRLVKLYDVIPEFELKAANKVIDDETNPDFNSVIKGYPESELRSVKYQIRTIYESTKSFCKSALVIPEYSPAFFHIPLTGDSGPGITGLLLDDRCELMNREAIEPELRKYVNSDAVINLLFSAIKRMAFELQLGGHTINIPTAEILRYPVTAQVTSDKTEHGWYHFHDESSSCKPTINMMVTMNKKITDAGCGYSGGDINTACKSETGSDPIPVEGTIESYDVSVENSAILFKDDPDLIFRTNNAFLVGDVAIAEKRVLALKVTVDK